MRLNALDKAKPVLWPTVSEIRSMLACMRSKGWILMNRDQGIADVEGVFNFRDDFPKIAAQN